jgi:hypothetical protein
LRTIYTPVVGGCNNYFCHSDFVAADVSPLISGRGKIGADSRQLPHRAQKALKTTGFARTDRKTAAQTGKRLHGREVGPHETGDRPHRSGNRRTNRKTRARMGGLPHGNGNSPHRLMEWLWEAIFTRTTW